MTNPLRLPAQAGTVIAEHVQAYGSTAVETGGFLLTQAGSSTITTIALAGTRGVTRGYGRFVLSMPVIDQLFTHAENNRMQVVAHFHSHAKGAFLSPIDQAGIIRAAGFIAIVIPTFADPPNGPHEWGWWTYRDGEWNAIPPALVADDRDLPVQVITVDADGLR